MELPTSIFLCLASDFSNIGTPNLVLVKCYVAEIDLEICSNK